MVRYMKSNYEKFSILYFVILCSFILFAICICIFLNKKIYQYKVFNGIYKDNFVYIRVDNYDKKLFYNNKVIYIDDEKYSFEIESINKVDNYYDISFSIDYEFDSEILMFSILERKEFSFKIFEVIWK